MEFSAINAKNVIESSALNIPNTTNTIDGYLASLKKKVAEHHGLRRDRRFKVISELMRNNGKK